MIAWRGSHVRIRRISMTRTLQRTEECYFGRWLVTGFGEVLA